VFLLWLRRCKTSAKPPTGDGKPAGLHQVITGNFDPDIPIKSTMVFKPGPKGNIEGANDGRIHLMSNVDGSDKKVHLRLESCGRVFIDDHEETNPHTIHRRFLEWLDQLSYSLE